MITLEEFHEDFLQSIFSDAESRGLLKAQAFFENVCEELVSIGDLSTNYTVADYNKKGLEVYGYDYDEERQIFSLLVHHFNQEDSIQTLTMSQIESKFKKLKSFFIQSLDGLFHQMDPAYEHHSMSYNIYDYYAKNKIKKLKLIIITDGKATRNLLELPAEENQGIKTEFLVIDIEYLYKIFITSYSGGGFEVEVDLPCLPIETNSDEYISYLTYLNGNLLVSIYEKFGQKLFEQNVRTFLQFKGGVNKGLWKTINNRPQMFFAYNNGITATASEVELNEHGNIIKIKDFQVVNGGQTTSSIYAANKNSKLDVSLVNVQMKLSVVKDKEQQNIFVQDVSRFANTQNKINNSDFDSNELLHKDFKEYARRVWAPATKGSQRRTHWFYERVRGEYLNEQAYLTPSGKKQFELENPRKQVIDKTYLSKSENVWDQKPDIVSKGAQYSFAEYSEEVVKKLEDNKLAITEKYFRDSISRIIMFKETEKMISEADWYNGGYRAQAVAYTLAYLAYVLKSKHQYLNFNIIWEEQHLPKTLSNLIQIIAEAVYENITNPPEGNANIGQWCKKKLCWDSVKSLNLNLDINEELLIDTEDEKYDKREDKKEKKVISDIEIQSFVVKTPKISWKNLSEYYSRDEIKSSVSLMQLDILNKYSSGLMPLPSIKQSKILYELYENAKKDGLTTL